MANSSRSKTVCLAILVAAVAAVGIVYRILTTRADYLLAKGQAALARNQWSEADRCLEHLEARGYGNHAHFLRGQLLLRKARLDGETSVGTAQPGSAAPTALRLAIHELAQIKNDGVLGLQGAVLRAECLVRLGERRLATELLQSVLQRNPDEKEAHQWLAAIYIDLNSPSQAVAHLREWGKLDPDNGRPYRWIGWFLSKDYGKLDEAIEAYREACRRNLEPALRAEVIKELATALVNGPAEYQAALETLAQGPELSEQPEILTLRAQCLWGLARLAEATEVLTRALKANPDLPEALRLRAKMFLAEGKAPEALPLLEKALKVETHDHLSRQLLMQGYKQLGDNARAEQERKLLEQTRATKERLTKLHEYAMLHPWDANVRNQIADLCQKLNLRAEAQMWRQAASACTADQTAKSPVPSYSPPERN
jgi:tetratricopeptide (TPR) repeat protein